MKTITYRNPLMPSILALRKALRLLTLLLCLGFSAGAQTVSLFPVTGTTFCAGSNISLGYAITGVFTTGNVFSIQLSDASGSFGGTPATIGSVPAILGGLINATIPAPTPPGTGYRIRVASTTPAIFSLDNGVDLTIVPKPVVTIATTQPTTFCQGGSVNLVSSATAGTSLQWYVDGALITGATAGDYTAASSGYYSVTASNAGCSVSSDSIHVIVKPLPVVTSTATSTCSGVSPAYSLTADIASTFTWTIGTITGAITGASASSGGTLNQPLTNPSNTTPGTVQYLVTATSTSGACPGAATPVVVTVKPAPDVTTVAPSPICSGTAPTINLTASIASTFSWTTGANTGAITGASNSSGTAISQTLTNPSHILPGSITYNVTAVSTAGSCTGTAAPITVVVNPAPALTSANSAAICSGTGPGLSLTAGISSTFAWTVGTITGTVTGATASSGGTLNQTLINTSNATAGSVVYQVTPTSVAGTCAGATVPVTITVNPKPAVISAASATICSGTSPGMALSASAASTFTWTVGTITGGITGATNSSGSILNQILINTSSTVVGTVQYNIIPTSVTGSCAGDALPVTITVNPSPIVVGTPSTVSICSGLSPAIPLSSSVPSTFSWTITSNPGGITGASAAGGTVINQTLTNPTGLAQNITYSVVPTSVSGSCPGTAFPVTVTVNPTPGVTSTTTASTCSGTSPNLSLFASVPSNFTWTVGTITGGITGATNSSGSILNQVLTNLSSTTAGTVVYNVTPSAPLGSCSGTSIPITNTVSPIPTVTTGATANACSGTSPGIPLSASAASNFTWTIGTITGGITGATVSSGLSLNQVLFNPSNVTAGSVDYNVTPITQSGSCPGVAKVITVTVNPVPVITSVAPAAICSGTSPNLVLSASAPSNFAWTLGTITGGITGASGTSGTTINQVLTNPGNTSAGSVIYIVTPTSTTNSCPGLAAPITVTVNPNPALTNATTAAACSGAGPNINLTATTASNFSWTVGTITGGVTGATANSGSVLNQTLTNPVNNASGTVVYNVTPVSVTGSCPGTATAITVTVNPIPAVTPVTGAKTCSGQSPNVILNASVGSNFAWTLGSITGGITGAFASSGATINQTLINPSNSATGTVIYNVTPLSGTGTCAGTALPVTVTVYPTPVVSTATTTTICSGTGGNINLTSSTPSTFAWTIGTNVGSITGASPNSGVLINQALTNPSNLVPGSIVYIVTPTSTANACLGIPTQITVTVNPAPMLTTTTGATCSGASPNILLAATAPSTYRWTIGSVSTGITGASPNFAQTTTLNQTLTNASDVNTGTVVYNVTPTSISGNCVGDSLPVTVTIYPKPTVLTATGTTCSGLSPHDTLGASTPSTFAWTIGTIAGNILNASASGGPVIDQVLTNQSDSTAGTVTYLVKGTSVLGSCEGPVKSVVVTVNPKPNVRTAATASTCSGTSPAVSLTASVPSTITWTVSASSASMQTPAPATGTAIINHVLTNNSDSTAGSVAYNVIPVSVTGTCTGNPKTITVTVNPKPAIRTAAAKSICSGNRPAISLVASTPSSFAWTVGAAGGIIGATGSNGFIINDSLTNPSTSFKDSVIYLVTPTATAGSCVGTPKAITVTVHPIPQLTSIRSRTICSQDTIIYNPTSSVSAADTFRWTRVSTVYPYTGFSTGIAGVIRDSISSGFKLTPDTVKYFYTITSVFGCSKGNQEVDIAVQPRPVSPVIATEPPAALCKNVRFQNYGVAAAAEPTVRYNWTASNALMYAQGPKPNSQYSLVSFPDGGQAIVTVSANVTGYNCFSRDADTVTVDNNNTAPLINVVYYNGYFVCQDNTQDSYLWGYDDASTLDSTVTMPRQVNQDYYNPAPDLGAFKYWVMTTKNGCTQKSYYNTPAGINTVTSTPDIRLKVYPNPAQQVVTVELEGVVSGKTEVILYDLTGKALKTAAIDHGRVQLPVDELAAGYYILGCYRDGIRIGTARIIKN